MDIAFTDLFGIKRNRYPLPWCAFFVHWSVPIGSVLSFCLALTALSRKDKTMKVEYKFADGTVSEVEAPEEIGVLIEEMNRTEASGSRLYRLHNYSLDGIKYEGEEYSYEDRITLEAQEENAFYSEMLSVLSNVQKRRFMLLVQGLSMHQIADIEGVDYHAVYKSVEQSRKKLQEFLKKGSSK